MDFLLNLSRSSSDMDISASIPLSSQGNGRRSLGFNVLLLLTWAMVYISLRVRSHASRFLRHRLSSTIRTSYISIRSRTYPGSSPASSTNTPYRSAMESLFFYLHPRARHHPRLSSTSAVPSLPPSSPSKP